MRKQMFGKILSLLLALIVVALSASGAVACTDNNCEIDDTCDDCDTCGACGNAWGEYGNSLGACGDAFGACGDAFGACGNSWGACGTFCEEANAPTWQELVLAFEHDGFEKWSGIDLAGLSNL
jgi:hypothetical protein